MRKKNFFCWQNFSFKLHLSLYFLLAVLGIFSLFRLCLFITYQPVFAGLTLQESLIGFLQGLRFDLSIIALFLGPLILLFFLPFKTPKWGQFCWAALCTVILLMLMLLTADFIYFPQAKRHMAEELFLVRNEGSFLLHYALDNFWWALLCLLALWAGLCRGGWLLIKKHWSPKPTPLWQTILICVLIAALAFTAIRGKLGHGKPLSMRDLPAISANTTQSSLMLNGVFSSYHSLRKGENTPFNPMDENEAKTHARRLLSNPKEIFISDRYPLMRQIKENKAFQPKNIFIVLLESWTPRYVDSFSGASYGVTPNFDRIAQNGVKFARAYATGVRSIYGLSATFTGVALVPGLPHFAYGLELNNVTSLAKALNQKGYYTAFIQSSLRSSYQMCNIAQKIFGIKESFGMEDIPRLLEYREEQDFGYDYDLLQFAADKAQASAQKGQPFLLFTFTGTTHIPFRQTTPEFDKYPRSSEENNYLNTLFYSDYAIGQLLRRAQEDGWLNDTIFIFMADHTLASAQKTDALYEKFNIPFVIYAPGFLAPKTISYPVSQLDLIPTLYHLLAIQEPFSSLGNDALDPNAPHFAFISEGTNLAFISAQGFIRHNRIQTTQCSADKDSPLCHSLAKDLLSLDKSVLSLFSDNSWFAPNGVEN